MNPISPGKNGRTKGRFPLVPLLVAAGLMACVPLAAAGTAPTNVVGAKIQFATPVHDFGKIKGGEIVKYTYVFTNVGDRLLEVSNVQASCGCTTAGEWSRQVEPGKTGSIPVQFNSGNFRGDVTKMITVTCNDAFQPSVMLQLKAHIWLPIEVMPQIAVLNVTSESPSNTTTVRIVNNEEAPLTLSAPESNQRAFAAEIRTNQPGKEFQLIVKTVPPLPAGTVQGQITLKTSSTNMPVINLTAFANVQQTVMVLPSQINLPPAPLANAMPAIVSIRNSGTNALVLTEPTVNAKGATVQLRELQPGRYFTLTVNFPAGLEIAGSDNVELSVKSSHPQFPVITVPIRQLPPPAPAPAATPAPGQSNHPPTR